METYYSLQDLISLSKEFSGNENPGIFVLSDEKERNKYNEAFCPTNIFVDEIGDIIIQIDKKLLD